MSHLPFRGLLCCPYHLRPPLLQVVQETGPQAEREEEVVCVRVCVQMCMCADVVGEEVGVEGGRDTHLFLALVKLCSGMAMFSVAYVTAAPSLSASKVHHYVYSTQS